MPRQTFYVLSVLAALSLSCALSGPDPTAAPTASPTAAPTATPEADPSPTAEPESMSNDEDQENIIPYPIMDDASQQEDFFGLYSYVTEYSVQEIVDFYKEQLPEMDLTLSSEVVGQDFAVLQFAVPEDNPMTINITTNDTGLRVVKLTD